MRNRRRPIPANLVTPLAALLILTACGGGGGSTATGPTTGPDVAFAPTSNTTLSGSVTYKSVSIPAGVTVTATSNLNLTVVGDATIAGTLAAQCAPIGVTAGGVLSVTGTVRVDCPDGTDSIPLTLVGRGGFNLNGATLSNGGNLSVTNDASLVSADLGLVLSTPSPERAGGTGNAPCQATNTTISAQPAKRAKAPDGVTDGGNGNSASYKELTCRGDLTATGLTMNGQSGADGGNGTSSGSTPSHGGFGGAAGALLITATGDITLGGSLQLNGGDGGNGGSATSTGAAGSPGVSVTAVGGKGGNVKPKNFDAPIIIQAGGALNVNGGINAVLGHGGNGGIATATAGNGNPGNPGANGGDATATGGNGGDGTPPIFRATGAVNIQGTITVSGGAAGNGGNALPTAGTGGAGNAPGAAGGNGGKQNGRGGNGGQGVTSGSSPANASASLASPPPFGSKGGNAGTSAFTGGNGGIGANNCSPAGPGGPGGKGGDVSGGNGTPGTGTPSGSVAGASSITNSGNGAKGGDGSTPGAGGLAGADGVPNVTPVGSFVPGAPGAVCGGTGGGSIAVDVFPATQTTTQGGAGSVQVTITRSGGFTGDVGVTVKDDQGNTMGSATIPASATQTEIGFSIPTNFTTGNHTFTVTASGTGVTPVTKSFSVTVNAANPGPTIQVASCDPNHPIVAAGSNTGSGWTPATGSAGTWTLSVGLGSKFSFYSTQQTALGYKTFVGFATPAEANNVAGYLCDWTRPRGMVTLPFINLPAGNSYNALLGPSFASAQSPATQAVFNDAVLGVPQYLVGAIVHPVNGIMQFAPYGQVTPSNNMVLPTLDLGMNMIQPVMKTYGVGNAGTDATTLNLLYGDVNGRFEGTLFGTPFSGPTQLFDVVPSSGLPSGAIQAIKFMAVDQAQQNMRAVKYYFRDPADVSLNLGPTFGPVAYSEPNASCRAGDFTFAINLQYKLANSFQISQGNRSITGYITGGYFGSSATAVIKTSDIPDICNYAPTNGTPVQWQFGGYGSVAPLFGPHSPGDTWSEAWRMGQQP